MKKFAYSVRSRKPLKQPFDSRFVLMKLAARRASTEDFQDMFTAMIKNYDLIDWSYLFGHARKLKVETLLESYKNLAQEPCSVPLNNRSYLQ